jgi:hypothetical protein
MKVANAFCWYLEMAGNSALAQIATSKMADVKQELNLENILFGHDSLGPLMGYSLSPLPRTLTVHRGGWGLRFYGVIENGG